MRDKMIVGLDLVQVTISAFAFVLTLIFAILVMDTNSKALLYISNTVCFYLLIDGIYSLKQYKAKTVSINNFKETA